MNQKKICIVIPVYNVKLYIERCIESILAQTIDDYEVLLIDDGSTDGSADLCDLISHKSKKFITYHKPNGGAGNARNYGIEKAIERNYQYIAFVDPDDTIEPAYLEILLKTIEENNADLAVCGYKKVLYKNRKVVGEKIFNNALEGSFKDYAEELCLLHKNTLLFSPWNKLFRVSVIKENNIQFGTTKRYEDSTFVYRFLRCTCEIAFTSEPLYCYYTYLNGRQTAVASFGNEYCEGAFVTYEEGQKIVEHMIAFKMKNEPICIFKKRLMDHLQSSLLGEMIINISFSSLSWHEREHYIKTLIDKYHQYNSSFDLNDNSNIGNMVQKLANSSSIKSIVFISYLYRIKQIF